MARYRVAIFRALVPLESESGGVAHAPLSSGDEFSDAKEEGIPYCPDKEAIERLLTLEAVRKVEAPRKGRKEAKR